MFLVDVVNYVRSTSERHMTATQEGGGGACVNIHELVNMLSRKEISGRVRKSVCHKSLKKARVEYTSHAS